MSLAVGALCGGCYRGHDEFATVGADSITGSSVFSFLVEGAIIGGKTRDKAAEAGNSGRNTGEV